MITLVRWCFGLDYVINGVNWFYKIITPYPSLSDFAHFKPPADVVGAMIENGVLFTAAKAIEVVAGAALLANRFVPLALVVAMTVSMPVFMVDVLHPQPRLRASIMGSGALLMNTYLLCAYFAHYRALLTSHATPALNPVTAADPARPAGVDRLAAMLRPLLRPMGVASALLGIVVVTWLVVMIAQYAANPQPISALRPLVPR